MHLRRQSFTNDDADTPSVDPVTSSGRGTLQRVDGNGLEADRRHVIAVTKGKKIDDAPLDEERTDLVHTGRAQVLARSGNDAGQHEEEGENDDGNFQELAAEPLIPQNRGADLLMAVAVIGLAIWAWRK